MIEQAAIKTLTSKYNVSGIALYLEVIFFSLIRLASNLHIHFNYKYFSLRSFANRFYYNE